MAWEAAVLPLVGVALGSSGTLIGHYLSNRVDARRIREQRLTDERAERRHAIERFLAAAMKVEGLIDRIRRGRSRDEAETDGLLYALWLNKQLLELVCSAELAQAVHDYSMVLESLAWADNIDPALTARRDYRWAMLEVARLEMGADQPLKRHASLARFTATSPTAAAVGREGPFLPAELHPVPPSQRTGPS